MQRRVRWTIPLALVSIALQAPAAQPWDTPFADDARWIAEAARKVARPDNPPAIILLEQHRYAIHAGGRTDRTVRKVYRIVDKDAVEDWSSVEQNYQPWYQQRPEIRARVISPDGVATWLDPKTIADSPAREYDSSVYSDARVLRAPLPSLVPGSVVEYEITLRDKAPLLDAGVTERIVVNDGIPIERFRVVVDAEPGVVLQNVAKLIPENALRSETGPAGTHLECELGPLETRKHLEWNLPADVPQHPYLAFSTGKSWQQVAARYEGIVNQRIQSADSKALLDGIDLKGSPREIASRMVARLHKEVRYTGVEFGEAAIIPATPAETRSRGYGDCKDKAALLVAMLRAAGLQADVALLGVGIEPDADASLPGLGVFDHAIVYVAGEKPLWIDATASDTRVGSLPPGDQGRLSLIANHQTTVLVETPEAESKDNWRHHTIEVKMSDYGRGTIVETMEAGGGSFESTARANYGSSGKLAELLQNHMKRTFMTKTLGNYDVMRRDDWSGPFHMRVEALQAATVNTGSTDAAVSMASWLVFEDVPISLIPDSETDDSASVSAEDKKPRREDFVFQEPFQVECRYKIVPPPLFKINNPPASEVAKLGSVTYTRHFQNNPDGTFEALYRLDSGKRRLSAAEFEAVHEGLKKYFSRKSEVLTLIPETSELIALGETGKAIALVRENAVHHPQESMAHIRFARMLLTTGMGGAALAESKQAVELDPKSPLAWYTLGLAYLHDTFGRPMQGNWNSAEAEKCYRKALELDPDDFESGVDLAVLLEHNPQGWRYARDARLEEAISQYRKLLAKQAVPQVGLNLTIALLRAGQLDAAKEEANKWSATLLLAAITAVQNGPARAVVGAQTLFPDPQQRAAYLVQLAITLVQVPNYGAAQVVMKAAARLTTADLRSITGVVEKIKPWEDSLVGEDDPRWPAQQLVLKVVRATPSWRTCSHSLLNGWLRACARVIWNRFANWKPHHLASLLLSDSTSRPYWTWGSAR